jgi:hypothetical protein
MLSGHNFKPLTNSRAQHHRKMLGMRTDQRGMMF